MPKINKISVAITVLLFLLFLYANIYTIKRMGRSGVELYLYDKLLVAYQVGGMPGLNNELERVFSEEKIRLELIEARDFKSKLGSIKDPGKFLQDIVKQKKERIGVLRILRNISFGIILVILLIRIILLRKRNLSPRS